MARSSDTYTGDGAKVAYNVSFPYIQQSHVLVYEDGVLQTLTTDYSWTTSSEITFVTAPASAIRIVFQRETSPATRLADWTVPDSMEEATLDEDSLQAFYLAQEGLDVAENAISLDLTDDKYDANSKVVKSVADGGDANDAVNKGQLDAIVAAAGAVPTASDPGDDNKVLMASGGLWSWIANFTRTSVANTWTAAQKFLGAAAAYTLVLGRSDTHGSVTIADIDFQGNDDAPATNVFGRIRLKANSIVAAATQAWFIFQVPNGGSIASRWNMGAAFWAETATGGDKGTGSVNATGFFKNGNAKFTKGADVVAAAALVVLGDGDYFDVTGTTTITSINTRHVGAEITLHFDAIVTLTHHATDLLLPGGVNFKTVAGDEMTFREYATGDWRCTSFTLASADALAGNGVLSSAITIVANGETTITHGLPTRPTAVQVYLKCIKVGGALGYSENDFAYITSSSAEWATASTWYGYSLRTNATQIILRFGNEGGTNVLAIVNASNGVHGTTTPADWEVYVRAWV